MIKIKFKLTVEKIRKNPKAKSLIKAVTLIFFKKGFHFFSHQF